MSKSSVLASELLLLLYPRLLFSELDCECFPFILQQQEHPKPQTDFVEARREHKAVLHILADASRASELREVVAASAAEDTVVFAEVNVGCCCKEE